MAKSLKDHMAKVPDKDKKYIEKFADKLSDSTQYAQWISGPNEHEDHPGQSLVTRSHEVIQKWAEERGAKPATIEDTEHDENLGVLRFDFPGYDQEGKLKEVSWEEFFKTFDDRDLAFIYQEHMKNGKQSNFFRFDNPHREDG